MKASAPKPGFNSGGPVVVMLAVAFFFTQAAGQTNSPAASAQEVLTTAREVSLLTHEAASAKRRAIIRGVVTCYLPDSDSLVIQDPTRGVYVSQIQAVFAEAPRLGDLFEIEGVTDPGQFAPQLLARKMLRLGAGELPKPAQPTWDQLINGSFDTQFVEIHGIVTAVRPHLVTLLTHAGKVLAHLYGTNYVSSDQSLLCYKNCKLRAQGCMFAMWDARTREVRVGEISMQVAEILVDEAAPEDLFALPRRHAAELRLFDPEASLLRRVLVSGQIIQHHDGEFFVMDGADGFRFLLAEPAAYAIGDLLDVAGFASLTGPSPMLQESLARKIGSGKLPQPKHLDPENLFDAKYDATRVSVEGVLQSSSGDQRILELQSGLIRFLARLERAGTDPSETQARSPAAGQPNLAVGSQLALTGVYVGHGANLSDGRQLGSFELLLSSPADIVVLARPPFWTLPRLLLLIGALLAVLILALIWIRLLHHKVQTRTAQLQVEVREREHAEQQRALALERSRIARDLHDDLGSSLTEVTLLATNTQGEQMDANQSSERLEAIAERSRTMVHSLDELVWAVDPERDTLASVSRYLASYAEEYLAGLKVVCRVQIPPSLPERSVSGRVRHELFLALKEALNNAVRHGHASEVGFRLQWLQNQIEFCISDNGNGFDPAHQSPGHGLPNLKTRLENLGGGCTVQSCPGGGTSVSLRLPLDSVPFVT